MYETHNLTASSSDAFIDVREIKDKQMSQYISKYHISKLATAKLVKVSPIMIAIAILWAIFLYYSGTAIS